MTPAARVAAAIGILDTIREGQPAEAALIAWSRASRFAGSKDRAAVRDLVFDVLRCRRSAEALGGGEDGRSLMLGSLRRQSIEISDFFTGEGHAPLPLTESEISYIAPPMTEAERCDWPDWLWPKLERDFGEEAAKVAAAQQTRAPVFIRTSLSRVSRDRLAADLAENGIETRVHDTVDTALEVLSNPRRLQQTQAWEDGWFDMQDASSQLAVQSLPLTDGQSVLDYCAGGGGKSLALADRGAQVTAHDGDAARMKDIPLRAKRAGLSIRVQPKLQKDARFDLVLVDAPCSGSGTWRRTPDAKWRLTPARLNELCDLQLSILKAAAGHVAEGGSLVYATCSVFSEENQQLVDRFLQEAAGWSCQSQRQIRPSGSGDGFFFAVFTK